MEAVISGRPKNCLLAVAVFLGTVIPLCFVKVQFFTGDEHFLTLPITAQGTLLLNSYHLVTTFQSWLFWWVLHAVGIEVAPIRAVELLNIFYTGVSAVLACFLGLFWGLKRKWAVLAALPMILSNGFVRYGISAYATPPALTFGLAFVLWLASWRGSPSKKGSLMGALIATLGVLNHATVLTMLCPLSLLLWQSERKVFWKFWAWTMGFLLIPYFGYIWMVYRRPEVVHLGVFNYFALFEWVYIKINLINTYYALWFPGIHAQDRGLDLLLNLPRLVGSALMILIAYRGIKLLRSASDERRRWMSALVLAVALHFSATCLFPKSRQYAYLVWVALAPLMILIFRELLERKWVWRLGCWRMRASSAYGIWVVTLFLHSIWGIEGIIYLSHRRSQENMEDPLTRILHESGTPMRQFFQ